VGSVAGVTTQVAINSPYPNAFDETCSDTVKLKEFCESMENDFNGYLDLQPGLYVTADCECVDAQTSTFTANSGLRRRLQETGSSIVTEFYIICTTNSAIGCPDALEDDLIAQAASVPTQTAFTATVATLNVASAKLAASTPVASAVPFYYAPPSPPSPSSPPCIAQCETFLDGASKYSAMVCVHSQPYSKTSCKPARSSTAMACDSGQTLCSQSACEMGKADKKGKWRDKKCSKKVTASKAAKKCKKKKIKKKCKHTCCINGA